jgi:transcriptional regulator with XRE-family HTH domain
MGRRRRAVIVDKNKAERSGLTLFAAELVAARSNAGLSQAELAGQINYSESMVSLVETARRVPSLDFAQRCDKTLGTPGTFARLQQHARLTPLPDWFLDTITGGYIEERDSAVSRVVLTFNTLRSEALPRRASRELIMKRAEDLESG